VLGIARTLAALGCLWVIGASVTQLAGAWGGGRKDHSQPQGAPRRGVLYNLTAAMLPTHKETVRHHLIEFAAGMMLHAGVLMVLLGAVLAVIDPDVGTAVLHISRPIAGLSLLIGVILLARRIFSWTLRSMSSIDDYLAILAVIGLLLLATGFGGGDGNLTGLLLYTALLLAYLPLGKLRHAVFFFAVRIDLGRRLGHRGTYPPPTESPHGR